MFLWGRVVTIGFMFDLVNEVVGLPVFFKFVRSCVSAFKLLFYAEIGISLNCSGCLIGLIGVCVLWTLWWLGDRLIWLASDG